ncbi:MAG: antibiotic biosynthesis monooxygenase [Nocardia sp.]|nr:antibiotic biosynthesis monooxygenase [Nocardia sp.]
MIAKDSRGPIPVAGTPESPAPVPEKHASEIEGRQGIRTIPAPEATEIAVGAAVVTLINIFTCAPERQDELNREWTRHTEQTMRHRPGFISANLHATLDGRKVTNYAQWESEQHLRTALADPDIRRDIAHLADIAVSSEPGLYRVVSVHHRRDAR